jgi:Holliday junction resolvase RusA-like endonuclease
MLLDVWLDGPPSTATAQQKGAFVVRGKIRFFTRGRVLSASRELVARTIPHAPKKPFEGPLRLRVTYCWHLLAADIKQGGGIRPMYRRPDADNLVKLLLDSLQRAGWFLDDGQISTLVIKKRRGPKVGMRLILERDETNGESYPK